jgi:3-oxoacyl-[acyl-carrier-protein] synthase III
MALIQSVITATGSCIPENKIGNNKFLTNVFFDKNGSPAGGTPNHIIDKFKQITGIQERRYAQVDQRASDLAYLAAQDALESGNIDRESLDYIIVAHNFGDVRFGGRSGDLVPSLASRVKYLLGIQNPSCIAYDIVFGCPGWLQAMIQADYYIRCGDARRCLVIGTETLSRVIDDHDRDSMIYADGSGATVLEASDISGLGILSHITRTFTGDYALLLNMERSYNPVMNEKDIFIKMNGRKLYEFALNHVPVVIKELLDKSGLSIHAIDKVLIHQANEKMDYAILERLFKLYNIETYPEGIMPITISWLGNSSVATIPTLLDLIKKGKIRDQQIRRGDKVLFASVGAGMNINAALYQF